jgi:hypothetical protein
MLALRRIALWGQLCNQRSLSRNQVRPYSVD